MKSPEEYFKIWIKEPSKDNTSLEQECIEFAQSYANHLLDVKNEEIHEVADKQYHVNSKSTENKHYAFFCGYRMAINHLKEKNKKDHQ